MTEQTPETPAGPAEQPQEGADKPQEGDQPQTFDAEYVAGIRKEAAKHRTEARAAATELEKFRTAAMSESEKAVAEAEARGRTAATTEFGTRLARTEFDAAAGRRNPQFKSADVLDLMDMTKLVGDDGEPDAKAIQAAVDRLVPAAEAGPPAFDGGGRTPPPATHDMNSSLRRAAGRT